MYPEPTLQELLKSMVAVTAKTNWPRCRFCEAELLAGESGFVCACGKGPIIPLTRTRMFSSQLSMAALRKMFPERST